MENIIVSGVNCNHTKIGFSSIFICLVKFAKSVITYYNPALKSVQLEKTNRNEGKIDNLFNAEQIAGRRDLEWIAGTARFLISANYNFLNLV